MKGESSTPFFIPLKFLGLCVHVHVHAHTHTQTHTQVYVFVTPMLLRRFSLVNVQKLVLMYFLAMLSSDVYDFTVNLDPYHHLQMKNNQIEEVIAHDYTENSGRRIALVISIFFWIGLKYVAFCFWSV